MSQLRQSAEELDRLGVRVAIVTFQAGPIVEAYARQVDLAWPILLDPERRLYRSYGMESGGWWSIWGPHSWWAYATLLLRGRKLERPTADIQQLGGDVLIDPEGRVRLQHVSANPADRPAVANLLRVVQDTRRQGALDGRAGGARSRTAD